VEDARWLIAEFVDYYNTVRLHGAIAYITPADKLAGHAGTIWAARRQKLAEADALRRARDERKEFAQPGLLSYGGGAWAEDRATRGRDLSAAPGAKTGAGGTMPPLGLPGLARKR
jgi:putative transposase